MLEVDGAAKWKKIQLLVQYGLRRREEIEKAVYRYPIIKNKEIHKCCEQQLENGISIIIIAVPFAYKKSLPNFLINTKEQLEIFFENEYNNLLENFIELWCCPQTRGENSFYGRLFLNLREIKAPMLLEIVWGKSTRMIDSYAGEGDYISQSIDLRKNEIDTLHYSKMLLPHGEMVYTAKEIQNELYRNLNNIMAYAEMLQRIGITMLCLEFTYKAGELAIIDFDTDDDNIVLKYFTKE